MTQREKAFIILRHLNDGKSCEPDAQTEKAVVRIENALDEIEEKEPTRTLREVQLIVGCVRKGIPVAVDYVDADGLESDPDGLIARACW